MPSVKSSSTEQYSAMSDRLTPEQRSHCMSQIRGKNTKPEIALRKALWRLGLRYRINTRLPGKPDLVFPGARVVVFVDGCFWHRCEDHYVVPKKNADFWEKKISDNVTRDIRVTAELENDNWSVLRVWEHSIEHDLPACVEEVAETISERLLYRQAKH